jgi:uncharacterized BrkB/YihY/UPF0761 family membrane protein
MCKNVCSELKRLIEDKSPLLVIGMLILFIASVIIFVGMLLSVLNNNLTLVPLSVLGVSALFLLVTLTIMIAMLYFACCYGRKNSTPTTVVVGAIAPVLAPVAADTGATTFTELTPLRSSSNPRPIRTSEKNAAEPQAFVGVNPLRSK